MCMFDENWRFRDDSMILMLITLRLHYYKVLTISCNHNREYRHWNEARNSLIPIPYHIFEHIPITGFSCSQSCSLNGSEVYLIPGGLYDTGSIKTSSVQQPTHTWSFGQWSQFPIQFSLHLPSHNFAFILSYFFYFTLTTTHNTL